MNNKSVLDQFTEIIKDALRDSNISNSKRFQYRLVEILLLIMVIPRKINFQQLGRYGEFGEQSYRQNFTRCLDWLSFNIVLAKRLYGEGGRKAIVIDPCFIKKAGNKTPHVGRFWSGCASAVQHGLEILGIGVLDVDTRDCMMLRAEQTHGRKELDLRKFTLNDWYLEMLKRHKYKLLSISKYLVADAWFSKYEFTHELRKIGFHLISRLRDDAVIYYIHPTSTTKKRRGRRRKWDGKLNTSKLKTSLMEKIESGESGAKAYTAIVFCKSLECKIRLVVYYTSAGNAKLFFSTDTSQSGEDVLEYYRTRFQIEFMYRDSKQFTGLQDCQARNEKRLDFAFNVSLAAVNVCKVLRAERGEEYSIGRVKSLMVNIHFVNRIFRMCGIRPNMRIIHKVNKQILGLPEEAA